VKEESKVVEVHVDKGMRDGQKIVLRGEGDQAVCITFTYIYKHDIAYRFECYRLVNKLSSHN